MGPDARACGDELTPTRTVGRQALHCHHAELPVCRALFAFLPATATVLSFDWDPESLSHLLEVTQQRGPWLLRPTALVLGRVSPTSHSAAPSGWAQGHPALRVGVGQGADDAGHLERRSLSPQSKHVN